MNTSDINIRVMLVADFANDVVAGSIHFVNAPLTQHSTPRYLDISVALPMP